MRRLTTGRRSASKQYFSICQLKGFLSNPHNGILSWRVNRRSEGFHSNYSVSIVDASPVMNARDYYFRNDLLWLLSNYLDKKTTDNYYAFASRNWNLNKERRLNVVCYNWGLSVLNFAHLMFISLYVCDVIKNSELK